MPGPSFEQSWIPFTQGCFVPSLVEIGPVLQEEKSLRHRQRRRTMDKFWSEKLTWAFRSGELKISGSEVWKFLFALLYHIILDVAAMDQSQAR